MMTTEISCEVSSTRSFDMLLCARVCCCVSVLVGCRFGRHHFNFDGFCSVCGVWILDFQACLGGVKTSESTIFVDLRGGASCSSSL
jgi:hypothetical protein